MSKSAGSDRCACHCFQLSSAVSDTFVCHGVQPISAPIFYPVLRYKHSTWSRVCQNMNIESSGISRAPWGSPAGNDAFIHPTLNQKKAICNWMPSKNLSKEGFSQTSLRDNYVHNCIENFATNQQAYSSWNTQPVIKLDSLERLGLLSSINISGQISAGFEPKIIVPRDCPQGWCELSTPAY